MPIRNLIIDLGGVLYATDQEAAYREFRKLLPGDRSVANLPPDIRHLAEFPVFLDLETGAISPAEFRDGLRGELGLVGSDEALDHAWNSLLVGVIPGREEDLRRLGEKYRLALLSNTNIIHNRWLATETRELFACFERCYLSYEMGMRKPSVEIYHRVLSESDMKAGESLFVDDSEVNIEGARAAGLQVFHLTERAGGRWEDLLRKL